MKQFLVGTTKINPEQPDYKSLLKLAYENKTRPQCLCNTPHLTILSFGVVYIQQATNITTKKMKKWNLLIIVIAIIAAVFYFGSEEKHFQSNPQKITSLKNTLEEKEISSNSSHDKEDSATKSEDGSSTIQITNKNLYSPTEKIQLTYEQIIEKNDWLTTHGFKTLFPLDTTNEGGVITTVEELHMLAEQQAQILEYEGYSLEILKEMAEVGDPRATLEIGQKLRSIKQYDEAEPYLEKAAVHGYASALSELSSLHINQAKISLKQGNADEAYQEFIEAYAWGHVMNLRFYPNKDEPVTTGTGVKLDKNTLNDIKNSAKMRAKVIYSSLKTKRAEALLGDFDNNIPDTFSY